MDTELFPLSSPLPKNIHGHSPPSSSLLELMSLIATKDPRICGERRNVILQSKVLIIGKNHYLTKRMEKKMNLVEEKRRSVNGYDLGKEMCIPDVESLRKMCLLSYLKLSTSDANSMKI